MIRLEPYYRSRTRWTILDSGDHRGTVIDGEAYAQGLTSAKLRELADRMDEEARKSIGAVESIDRSTMASTLDHLAAACASMASLLRAGHDLAHPAWFEQEQANMERNGMRLIALSHMDITGGAKLERLPGRIFPPVGRTSRRGGHIG